MELVGEVALLSDLTLCAGERVVLGENSDGSSELLEEVVLALGHLLHISLMVAQLVKPRVITLISTSVLSQSSQIHSVVPQTSWS